MASRPTDYATQRARGARAGGGGASACARVSLAVGLLSLKVQVRSGLYLGHWQIPFNLKLLLVRFHRFHSYARACATSKLAEPRLWRAVSAFVDSPMIRQPSAGLERDCVLIRRHDVLPVLRSVIAGGKIET